MRRIRYIIELTMIVTVLLCACGNEGKADGTQTDSAAEESWQSVEKEPMVGHEDDRVGDSEWIAAGRALEGLARVGRDDPYYCNVEENIRVGFWHPDYRNNLVSRDSVYGITYYVNYGRDYYIYALRADDRTEAAVQLPATDLYCRDGILYFIAKDYENAGADWDGQIFSYDPLDGSVKPVTDQRAERMNVYPDGILLDCWSDGAFYYSFETEKINRLENRGMDRVGEYRMRGILEEMQNSAGTYIEIGYAFEDRNQNVVKEIGNFPWMHAEAWYVPRMFRLNGNVLYSVETHYEGGAATQDMALAAYHTDTGVREELFVLEDKIWQGKEYDSDFIFYDGLALFTTGYCLDLATGEASYLDWKKDQSVDYSKDDAGDAELRRAFYTDGERLFYLYDDMLYQMSIKKKARREPAFEKNLNMLYEADYTEIGELRGGGL